MKKLLSLFFIFNVSILLSQNTILKENTRLDADVVLENDTISISSDKGFILDVYVIKRINRNKSVRDASEIIEYDKHYKLLMSNYDKGTYTVVVNMEGNLYPFNFIRNEDIEKEEINHNGIDYYMAEHGTKSAFSQYTIKEKPSRKEVYELIKKYYADRATKNGSKNWIRIYAVYKDGGTSLIYKLN